ncbi:MAG: YggS family pyridoxal phosphate-dependent enzyme [Clostridia bacterium]|nr:YggS family pyridoxal phosphate-dependent enzyme [Clostridia bacterium]
MDEALLKQRFYDIEENYKTIMHNIGEAAVRSGRASEDIRFMAVTKTVDSIFINHALSLGIDLIGENRVQEFLGKRDELNLSGVEKHLIGHLQTNKVRQIVGEVDMIDGVDSVKVAKEIGKVSQKKGIITDVLVEVNIGGEESKFGLDPSQLYETVCEISEIEGIKINGLMAIPPICTNEDENRKFFANMYTMFLDIKAKKLDNVSMNILSMGMSDDYAAAILEGSTMVRVGSSLFGRRVY